MQEKRDWVYTFLLQHGCFEDFDNDPSMVIKRMKISSNVLKEQVVIECHKYQQVNIFAKKLIEIPSLFTMSFPGLIPPEIKVYISWVRSNSSVIDHLLFNFLYDYGKVLNHWPVKDSKGIETFEHCFVMLEEDILNNPPPGHVWMGRKKLRV